MSGQKSLLHSKSSALRAAFSSLPCYDGCRQLMTVPVWQSINTTWNHPRHLRCKRTGVQIARKCQVRRRNSRNSRNSQVRGCESQPSTPCEHQNGWQMGLHIHHCPSPWKLHSLGFDHSHINNQWPVPLPDGRHAVSQIFELSLCRSSSRSQLARST